MDKKQSAQAPAATTAKKQSVISSSGRSSTIVAPGPVKAPKKIKRGRQGSEYKEYMDKAKKDLLDMQAKIDSSPRMKNTERKRIENRMSALRSRMRKKEQAEREQIKVREIADIIENVLSDRREPTGKKFYDKIKDKVDKACKKMKLTQFGESLADSISLYYDADEGDLIEDR